MNIIQTPDQKIIWDIIENRIEENPCDGINAQGNYSADVHSGQRSFIAGMRSARLAAIRAIDPKVCQPNKIQDDDTAQK